MYRLTNDRNIAIINVIYGSKPTFNAIYERGRFNIRIPPTRIWYTLTFPVAKSVVINGYDRDSINVCIIISFKNKTV